MSEIVFRRRVAGLRVNLNGDRAGVLSQRAISVASALLDEALCDVCEFPPPQLIILELKAKGKPGSRYERANDWVTVSVVFNPQGTEDDPCALVRILTSIRDSLPLVLAALPPTHGFDATAFESVVERLLRDAPTTQASFDALDRALARGGQARALRAYHADVAVRSKLQWPRTVGLVGVRAYANEEPLAQKALHQVAEVFAGALIESRLLTPGYKEIYFRIASTYVDAVNACHGDLTWHRSVPVVVAHRIPAEIPAAFDLVAPLLANAARDIARIDGLDTVAVERALERIRTEGLSAKFLLCRTVKSGLDARICYRVGKGLDNDYCLDVMREGTKESVSVPLGSMDSWVAAVRFLKLVVLRDRIRIVGKRGMRADAWRGSVPLVDEYALTKLFP